MKAMENMLFWISVITLVFLICGIGFVVAAKTEIDDTQIDTSNPFN
jgi:hypothetical protein